MPPSIRPATPHDLPGIVALLIRDAEERRSLEPLLWGLATDAAARIERAVGGALDKSHAPAENRGSSPRRPAGSSACRTR